MSFKDHTIATLGSHSALQILKGAKDEGFKTLVFCEKGKSRAYKSYKVADEIIEIDSFKDYFKEVEPILLERNATLIPHGSIINAIGATNAKNIASNYYGSKGILEWESDRKKERKWLLDAGLKLPRIFETPEDIDCPVIIKFHGAKGGSGYFIAKSAAEFYERIKEYPGDDDFVIQEYIVGVPIYAHYFQSNLTGELEIMGFDKRYESNADSIGRIAAKDQLEANIHTSYTITGNIPLVVRESLLPMFFNLGDNIVESSKKLTPTGLFGPFCLEGIIDTNLNFYVFEISARIVAGTNPYINGSPYTALRYDVPMSTGRRIALEIKNAIKEDKLDIIHA
jgi:5-formaminoimidazole-4-carboxamide-1-(beta)-D-ribofuranosyl 5'-monophosphate synthetase